MSKLLSKFNSEAATNALSLRWKHLITGGTQNDIIHFK